MYNQLFIRCINQLFARIKEMHVCKRHNVHLCCECVCGYDTKIALHSCETECKC